MSRLIDTLLLTALPASGKSEVRRYLALLDEKTSAENFHMGPTVQLDDYPYVHMMRRISQELSAAGHAGIYFPSNDQPFSDPRDWGTLIELLNEDYRDLHEPPNTHVDSAAEWLFGRLDAARRKSAADPALGKLPADLRARLVRALEGEARRLLDEKRGAIPEHLEGRTIVLEFARGGPQGASMPLEAPYGYAYSFARLSHEILARASILYIWVTPEESRRKNEERARPGREGDASILHHGVPIAVMLGDYGIDDMAHLIEQSDRPDCIRIETHGRTYHLPVARFDNRQDLTTFIREERSKWSTEDIAAVHSGLQAALTRLVEPRRD